MREPQQAHDHDGNEPEGPGTTTPTFAARLRRLRRQRGLSLADLARQTHYSKGYLSKIETGAKPPTVDVARRCDRILAAEGELLALAEAATTREHARDNDIGAPACPYRGLSAFTAQDAEWFFGRERATAALVEQLFQRIGDGPLMLVAPSGAGKSSLLSAGLVPALGRPGRFPMPGADRWPVVSLTPTARPLEELLERTAKALGCDLRLSVAELRDKPRALLDAVHRLTDAGRPESALDDRRPPPVCPVLLVDQFEELFTLCPDEGERRAYVRVLCALATAAPSGPPYDPAVVVLGLRADFSGRCLELPELASV
ncbi:ATP-binding protein, partial [Streptomyces sp. NPDC001215]